MMNDKTDKLSALMDGELRDLEQWSKQLASDKAMQAVWHRYHIARDAMKGQLSDYPELDISDSVSKALENEPVILAPLWRRIQPRAVFRQVAGLAVAATVATLAVLSVQQAHIIDNETAQIAQLSTPVNATGPVSGAQLRQVSFTTRQQLDAEVESRLSGYLVNHNEYSPSIRVSGIMPYTRIVSYVADGTEQQDQHDK